MTRQGVEVRGPSVARIVSPSRPVREVDGKAARKACLPVYVPHYFNEVGAQPLRKLIEVGVIRPLINSTSTKQGSRGALRPLDR